MVRKNPEDDPSNKYRYRQSDLYKDYMNRLDFEHELINRRVTWLLTSQSILFAIYGIVLNSGTKLSEEACSFLTVISSCGFVICISSLVGISASALAKRSAWKKYQDESKNRHEPWGGLNTIITSFGLVPDLVIPLVFVIAWAALL